VFTLRVEHPVNDFGAWKAAFDSDPGRRERSGVLNYRVLRPVDDALFVCIDLDFETREAAESFVKIMEPVWRRVEGSVITGPRVRMFDCVEQHAY